MLHGLPHPDVWHADQLATIRQPVAATGWAMLDEALPGGGWPLGAVVEIGAAPGVLPWRLLLPVLRSASAQGMVALVGLPLLPNAAAWAAHGIAVQRLWRLETRCEREALWCAEQLLGCPETALCWLHATPPSLAWTQRLQQAAAAARRRTAPDGREGWPAPLVVLSRPVTAAGLPGGSAAPLRLQVHPEGPATLAVRVCKRRGPPLTRPLHLHAPWPWSEWSTP